MKRDRSTSKLAHVRASSIEFARAVVAAGPQLLQSARDEFAIVHKRLRGLAVNASVVAPHAHPQHGGHHRRHSSMNAAAASAAFFSSSASSDCGNGAPQSSSGVQPHASLHVTAAQLQFYGFYSTTAFDRTTISAAEAIILAAEMAADFFSEASMLYDMLSEIKSPNDETRAVDELMKRMSNLLSDNSRLPRSPAEVAAAQVSNVRNVYNGLVRVYIFLFQRHYREFLELEVDELLAASWQRLLAFAAEYKILEEDFILKVLDYVAKLVSSFKC
ncbi:hypothetical protein Gpo141_00005250 [Globisporangium polare]